MHFSQAIVRTPCSAFADGLTTAGLGRPNLDRTLEQHATYVRTLQDCGLEVTTLSPEVAYPDSTFVEDTAILTEAGALFCRPGAPSRQGEVELMRPVLAARFQWTTTIESPGTLDGGDVCEVGGKFFVGLSDRTNEEGAVQLGAWLSAQGRSLAVIDIRRTPGLLHLKSGLAAVDSRTLIVVEALVSHPALSEYKIIRTPTEEGYAANCVGVNGRVLVAKGFPNVETLLRAAGCIPYVLDMSEFQKMDGGLSCLSLRY